MKLYGHVDYRWMTAVLLGCGLSLWVTCVWGAESKGASSELLTAENYAKVEKGLSAEEVKEILGKPKQGSGVKGDWTSVWPGPDGQKIEVHFKNQAVDRKSTSFTWGKADPKAKPAKEPKEAKKPLAKGQGDKYDDAIADLRSPDEKKRHDALKKLARLPFDEDRAATISKYFMAHLHDKDLSTRMTAEEGMEKWITPENADHFLAVLEHRPKTSSPTDPDLVQIQFAIRMLVKLKEPRAAAPMCKLLKSSFFERTSAADGLKELGPELAQAEVLKYANDKDGNVQLAVSGILDKFKTSAADKLSQNLTELKSERPERRYLAAVAIYNLPVDPQRQKEVAAALQAMLNDHPGELSAELKKAEKDARQEKAGNSLAALMTEQQKHPANAALSALGRWGGPENQSAVDELLTSKIIDIRCGAAQTLGKIGDKRSLPALQKAQAVEKDNEVGRFAREAIDAINSRGK